MADPAFRRSQVEGLRLPHVAPINRLIDDLHEERGIWLPYVAPVYGGTRARMLMVAESPGPMTNPNGRRPGSGFLSLENDDPTAELMAWLLDEAQIPVDVTTAWNAYPWYINRTPSGSDLNEGVEPLRRLLELLPELTVVLLRGSKAKTLWNEKFSRTFPQMAGTYHVIATFHTGKQAFIGPRSLGTPEEIRAARMAHLRASVAGAARILGYAPSTL